LFFFFFFFFLCAAVTIYYCFFFVVFFFFFFFFVLALIKCENTRNRTASKVNEFCAVCIDVIKGRRGAEEVYFASAGKRLAMSVGAGSESVT